jgi:hypothetical protein
MGKSVFKRDGHRPLLLGDDSSTGIGGSSKNVLLYDTVAMLDLKSSICEGYITLLTGSCEQAKVKNDREEREKAFTLAFASLADGNVVDACFGMRISSKENNFTTTLIKEAKSAIDEAANFNERSERIAVEAYKNGFKTVIEMNTKLDKLNIFTACFLEKKIRNKATAKLENNFLQLEQAITGAM